MSNIAGPNALASTSVTSAIGTPLEASAILADAGTSLPTLAEADPWEAFFEIPLRLAVEIYLPAMSMRALAALTPGQVLLSSVPTTDELPIAIGGALVSWARFECVGGRMAMRVTRLN